MEEKGMGRHEKHGWALEGKQVDVEEQKKKKVADKKKGRWRTLW